MQKNKNEKGITLVILVITLIVIALISIPVVVNTTEIGDMQKYTYFKGDIDKLRESIETTYSSMASIATIGPRYYGNLDFLDGTQNGQNVKNPNDGAYYYVINLEELNSHLDAQINLKYGTGNKNTSKDTTDVYIINAQSRTIYYVKGMKYKEETYYRLPEEFSMQNDVYIVTFDANGGTNAPSMQTVDVNADDKTITIVGAPKRSGYTFKGYKASDEESTLYVVGDTYTVTQDTDMIAQWEKK